MDIPEAATDYPDLDLYELSRQIKAFLKPYSFVASAYLYHGANKAKYHIIFKVPTPPEGCDETHALPHDPRSNAEKLKDFFKIEEPVEVSTEPKTAAELYAKFYDDIQWPVLMNLNLDEVYRRDKPPHDPKPGEEWEWSIVDANNNVLTGFYPITSLGYAGDIKDLGLRDLIQPGKPVLLYEGPNSEEFTNPRKAIEDEIRDLEQYQAKNPGESLEKDKAIKAAHRRLKSLTEPRRLNQRHKLKVREAAQSLWQKHPGWTIQKLIDSDEINAITTPRVYTERTLRDWIKDLAPDRRPGRRKTTP
ncbi:MAG: hypothetical protein M0P30_13635 [Syntrophorhabdaceae bacterium]|nr:hypothetical protein [Syntrophorhabdaceae bacterium]